MNNTLTSTCLQDLFEGQQHNGLFVLFDNGDKIDLTEPNVRKAADDLEEQLPSMPPETRTATELEPCAVCPARDTAAICHALPAIIPFLNELRLSKSFDQVTAIFIDEHENHQKIYHICRTSMQRALQYVAIQSVLYYCEIGKSYHKYFGGVIPFSPAEDIAERIYANIMLEQNGNHDAVLQIIEGMRTNLSTTMQCQLKRVRLVSKNDVFLNAFVNLHLVLDMLAPENLDELRHLSSRRIERNPAI